MKSLELLRRAAAALAAALALALVAPTAIADRAHEMLQEQDWQSTPPKLAGTVDGWVKWLKYGTYDRSGGQPFAAPVPPGLPPDVTDLYIDIEAGAHTGPPGCTTFWREIFVLVKFSDGSQFLWWRIWRQKICDDGSIETFEHISASAGVEDPLTGAWSGWIRSYSRENLQVHKRAAMRAEAGATLELGSAAALPRPLVGGGHDAVDVTLGPGGVLDLRGLDGVAGPLFDTGAPVTVRCDQILLDPGVVIADLFQPPPIVLPGEELRELALLGPSDAYFDAPGPAAVALRVANVGNAPLTADVTWSDGLSWASAYSQTVPLEPGSLADLQMPFLVPPVPTGSVSPLQVQASAPLAPPVDSTAILLVVDPATPVGVYCSAKVNSLGCVPRIGASGAATLTGYDDFLVTASDVLSGMGGVFFYGLAPLALPFQGGTLCVAPPVLRSPLNLSGGSPPATACDGLHVHHFTQADLAAAGLAAGTTVYGQWWTRDANDPLGSGLTDALQFTVGP